MKTIKYDVAEEQVAAQLDHLLLSRRDYLKAFADQHKSERRLKQTQRAGRKAFKAFERELKRSVVSARSAIKKTLAATDKA